MAESKVHYVGQLQTPGRRPQNIDLIVDSRPNPTAAETAAGIERVDARYLPGDTRRYINGLADAVLVAEQDSATVERDIYFGASEAWESGDELIINAGSDDIRVNSAPGTEITYTGTGTAVTIGGSGTQTNRVDWDVRIRKTNQSWDDGTDTTSIGLRIDGLYYGRIYVDVEGFNWGLACYTTDEGNSFNRFLIKLLLDNRFQIVLDRASAGWNNSNRFEGGYVTYRSGTINTVVDNSIVIKHLLINNASDNGNQFEDLSFELASNALLNPSSYVIEIDGQWTRLSQCRIEVSDQYTQQVKLGSNALYNYLDFGRVSDGLTWEEFLVDDSDGSNAVLWNRNEMNWGSYRRQVTGALQAAGRPTGARYDSDFEANIVAGPNIVSAADKILAGIGSGNAVVFGLTGTGRHAIGKDPETGYGHDQFIDADADYSSESVNRATFHRNTTDATPVTVNVDSINPPEGAGVWIVMKVVCFDDSSTVGMARIRAAFIQRIGTGNLAIHSQSNIFDALDGGPAAAVFSVTGTQINLDLTGIAGTSLRWSGTLEWQYCSVFEVFSPTLDIPVGALELTGYSPVVTVS